MSLMPRPNIAVFSHISTNVFIGDGILPEQMGRTVHKALDLRQRGDYREYQEIASDQVGPLLEQADAFVRAVRQYLEKHIFIEEG